MTEYYVINSININMNNYIWDIDYISGPSATPNNLVSPALSNGNTILFDLNTVPGIPPAPTGSIGTLSISDGTNPIAPFDFFKQIIYVIINRSTEQFGVDIRLFGGAYGQQTDLPSNACAIVNLNNNTITINFV